jgi:hypothetical protein
MDLQDLAREASFARFTPGEQPCHPLKSRVAREAEALLGAGRRGRRLLQDVNDKLRKRSGRESRLPPIECLFVQVLELGGVLPSLR